MNGKLGAGDMDGFAKLVAEIAESDKKARDINSYLSHYGNWSSRNSLSATLAVSWNDYPDKPNQTIDKETINELTDAEYRMILGAFIAAQNRVTMRLAQKIKDYYGVAINGITPDTGVV